jgi:hypothetical protein
MFTNTSSRLLLPQTFFQVLYGPLLQLGTQPYIEVISDYHRYFFELEW